MATKKTFIFDVDDDLRASILFLKSAACEWVLLCLLLIYAAFSYFLVKFAQYCDLPLPCIICSRLDHLVGKGKRDFYKQLLCADHCSEISSLVSCSIHGKLADVHDMCEECLLSFAMKKETSSEICKFLIGKLGLDGLRNPVFSTDFLPGPLNTRSCSCCGKQWRCRPGVQKLVQPQSAVSTKTSKPDIPLPSPRHHHKSSTRVDGLKRRDRLSATASPRARGGCRERSSLSNVEYAAEMRFSSDSDSDFPFSDEEDLIKQKELIKDDRVAAAQQGSKFLFKKQFDECFPPKQVKLQPNEGRNSPLDRSPRSQLIRRSLAISSNETGRESDETKWHQQTHSKQPSTLSELSSLDEIPLSSAEPAKTLDSVTTSTFPKKSASSALTEFILNSPRSPSKIKVSLAGSKEIDGEIGARSKIKNMEPYKLSSSPRSRIGLGSDPEKKESRAISTPNRQSRHTTEFGSSPKAADSSSQSLPNEAAAKGEKENVVVTKTNSDEAPSVRFNDPSSSIGRSSMATGQANESHKISTQPAESHRITTQQPAGSKEVEPVPKTPLLMKSQSYESLDRLWLGDPEGGAEMLEQLKRQVELDRKCISKLRKELEDERSASTEAANQAMAMITKLQEEKAALNMEALQYLRMMEEQAEHDMDALEKSNDMLAEREKEIQDMEAELDFYRMKYPEEFEEEFGAVNMMGETHDLARENELDMDDLETDNIGVESSLN